MVRLNYVALMLAVALLPWVCEAAAADSGISGLGSEPPLLSALRNHDDALALKLASDGANVNAHDELGITPLIWAAQHVDLDWTARLLKAGAKPNISCDAGLGPLQIAIANHAAEIANLLLENGASAKAVDNSGETALMTAARTGQLDLMRQLISRGSNVNAFEATFHQTALMWSTGFPEEVRLLIKSGADIHARTKVWVVRSPIYTAAYKGHLQPWASDGEYESKRGGQTALLFAVQKQDIASVRLLLDAGADINDAAADGSSALLLALYNWKDHARMADQANVEGGVPPFDPNVELANLLLDRGANVNVTNTEGFTPLLSTVLGLVPQLRTVENSRETMIKEVPIAPIDLKTGLRLIGRLVGLHADVNATTRYPSAGPIGAPRLNDVSAGSAALHIAARIGSVELVETLLEHGAEPDRLRKDGHTPLSLAVEANDLAVATSLVAHGADATRLYNLTELVGDLGENGSPSFGEPRSAETLLHIAAAAGAYRVVAFLADHHTPLDVKNDHGETALSLAVAQEHIRFVGAKYGADVLQNSGFEAAGAVFESQTSDAIRKAINLSSTAVAGYTPGNRPSKSIARDGAATPHS